MTNRDIYEVSNQLMGYVGPNTDEKLAKFLIREGEEAAKLANSIDELHERIDDLVREISEFKYKNHIGDVNKMVEPTNWQPLPTPLKYLP